jgi:hypothetical protein
MHRGPRLPAASMALDTGSRHQVFCRFAERQTPRPRAVHTMCGEGRRSRRVGAVTSPDRPHTAKLRARAAAVVDMGRRRKRRHDGIRRRGRHDAGIVDAHRRIAPAVGGPRGALAVVVDVHGGRRGNIRLAPATPATVPPGGSGSTAGDQQQCERQADPGSDRARHPRTHQVVGTPTCHGGLRWQATPAFTIKQAVARLAALQGLRAIRARLEASAKEQQAALRLEPKISERRTPAARRPTGYGWWRRRRSSAAAGFACRRP